MPRKMILDAGTFRVADYRKAIPDHVKVQSLLNLVRARMRFGFAGTSWVLDPGVTARDLQFDHRPSLQDRPYDTVRGDFVPGQNDPTYIEAILKADHGERTTGRKAGAEKTVTTIGSDSHTRTHTRHLQDSNTIHEARMAEKRGDAGAASRILGSVKQKTRLRPKQKIPSRPFPKRLKSY